MRTAGILLAAGGGARMGGPKSLMRHGDGRSWVETSLLTLLEGGCDPVVVVIGAEAPAARAVIGTRPTVSVLENARWQEGIGGSLGLALDWCSGLDSAVVAALVMLVDTPGIGPAVVRHVRSHASDASVLARAAYGGKPHGHPVLLGRQHWAELRQECSGDRGARRYLEAHAPHIIDCTPLGRGADLDTVQGVAGIGCPS